MSVLSVTWNGHATIRFARNAEIEKFHQIGHTFRDTRHPSHHCFANHRLLIHTFTLNSIILMLARCYTCTFCFALSSKTLKLWASIQDDSNSNSNHYATDTGMDKEATRLRGDTESLTILFVELLPKKHYRKERRFLCTVTQQRVLRSTVLFTVLDDTLQSRIVVVG